MDSWVAYFKANPVLVGALVAAVTGLLGIVLKHFLDWWNSVENRRFTRRDTTYDRKIKEARDVLEKWTSFIYFSMETGRMMSEEKSLQRIARDRKSTRLNSS